MRSYLVILFSIFALNCFSQSTTLNAGDSISVVYNFPSNGLYKIATDARKITASPKLMLYVDGFVKGDSLNIAQTDNYAHTLYFTSGNHRLTFKAFSGSVKAMPISVTDFNEYYNFKDTLATKYGIALGDKFWPSDFSETGGRPKGLLGTQTNLLKHIIVNAASQSAATVFDWSTGDQELAFAIANNYKSILIHSIIIGHDLGRTPFIAGHEGDTAYLRTELKRRVDSLANHIKAKLAGHPEIKRYWLAVNEFSGGGPSTTPFSALRLPGSDDPDDYMKLTVMYLRAADPDGIIVFNDYRNEVTSSRGNRYFNTIKKLRDQGYIVDVAGFQYHLFPYHAYTSDSLIANFKRFGDIGVGVAITEMDVPMTANNSEDTTVPEGTPRSPILKPTKQDYDIQNRAYGAALDAMINAGNGKFISYWYMYDPNTYRDRNVANPTPPPDLMKPFRPNLLDSNLNMKPAFAEKLNVLYTQDRKVPISYPAYRTMIRTGWGTMNLNGTYGILNGSISQSFIFPAKKVYRILITASGTPYANVYPGMILKVDGVSKKVFTVNSDLLSTYALDTITLSAGSHTIAVELSNPSNTRSLNVYSIDISDAIYATGSGKVKYISQGADDGIYMNGSSASIQPGDLLVIRSIFNNWTYANFEGINGTAALPIKIMNDGLVNVGSFKFVSSSYINLSGASDTLTNKYGFFVPNSPYVANISGNSHDISIDHVEGKGNNNLVLIDTINNKQNNTVDRITLRNNKGTLITADEVSTSNATLTNLVSSSNILDGAYVADVVPGDVTPPVLLTTSPGNGASNIPTGKTIQFNFDEAVLPPTLSNFTISPAATVTVNMVASKEKQWRMFGDLAYSTIYTVTAKDISDLSGNIQTTSYSKTFTTAAAPDTTKPGVTEVDPSDGEMLVDRTVIPSVKFSKKIQGATVTSLNVKLLDGTDFIAATPQLQADSQTINFNHITPFGKHATYSINISGIKDNAGNTMTGAFTSIFTTEDTVASAVLQMPANLILPQTGGISLTIDGSQSSGSTYQITQTQGKSVALVNANTNKATTTITDSGTYAFKLVVTNLDGDKDSTERFVTVNPAPVYNPVIVFDVADKFKKVQQPQDTVSINADSSKNLNGSFSELRFTYSLLNPDRNMKLINPNSSTAIIEGLSISTPGYYTIKLQVSDNLGNSTTDYFTIQVIAPAGTCTCEDLPEP